MAEKMKNKPEFLNMRWSKADDQMLMELIQRGVDGNSIARALCRTRNSVFNRKHRLGISGRIKTTPRGEADPPSFGNRAVKQTPKVQPKVEVVQEEPKTFKKPGSLNTRWSKADDQMLRELIQRGADGNSIARALGRTRRSVFNRKYVLGIDGRIKITPRGKADPPSFGTRTVNQTPKTQHKVETVGNEPKPIQKAKTKKTQKSNQLKETKIEKGRLPQSAKLAQINRRLRRGDIRKVAQKTGFTEGFVSSVISGISPNERVINVAFNMLRGRKTNEQMMRK
jgi:hypothetical protein